MQGENAWLYFFCYLDQNICAFSPPNPHLLHNICNIELGFTTWLHQSEKLYLHSSKQKHGHEYGSARKNVT
jgi:hypothetical protein